MNEKLLLFIAFVGSLIGVTMLFLMSESIGYDEKTIEKINSEKIQDMVKIEGEVTRVTNLGNVTFISVRQPSYIDIVVFDDVVLYEGETVEIIGRGEEYEGKMEVIAHRIRVVG